MIELPRHGFGAAPIGGLFEAVSDEQARATVDAAWSHGVRLFDTAPHYGVGLSERRLGAALADRKGYVLSTKVGRLLVPSASGGRDGQGFDVPAAFERVWDFSGDGVRRSLEESLARLGLDRVDIALIHDPDAHADQAISEAYPALAELRSQGVIGAIGVGMNQWQVPLRFVQETDIDVVMLAGRYTLIDQSGLPLLDACADRGVRVLAAGVFDSGLLATSTPGGTYNYGRPRRGPQPRQTDRQDLREVRRAAPAGGHGLSAPAPGGRLHRHRRPLTGGGRGQRGALGTSGPRQPVVGTGGRGPSGATCLARRERPVYRLCAVTLSPYQLESDLHPGWRSLCLMPWVEDARTGRR